MYCAGVLCIYLWLIAPTAAPRNVTALSVHSSSLLVSWLPPLLINHNGNLTGYAASYSRVGSNNVHSVQLSANVTMYKITQLIPSTEYRIQVACIIVNGTDPFSAYIEVLSGDNSKFILTIISILILLYMLSILWQWKECWRG